MSRDGLLYLDDLIASAEKIGRLTRELDATQLAQDEAAFDAVLFNLQVIWRGDPKPARGAGRPPVTDPSISPGTPAGPDRPPWCRVGHGHHPGRRRATCPLAAEESARPSTGS